MEKSERGRKTVGEWVFGNFPRPWELEKLEGGREAEVEWVFGLECTSFHDEKIPELVTFI